MQIHPRQYANDQIQKIHNIIGTPSAELLGKMKQRSAHMDFNFPQKSGSGIEKLIPHATPECIDLINKLLAYNPDDRLSARQALRHPYFREIREMEKRQYALMNPKADGTLSGSGGDDSRKGHHGSAVTSSDARSDRTRRSRASASVASTSVPSIAGKGIGEGIGGYEPGVGTGGRSRGGRTGRTVARLPACTAATTRALVRTTAGPMRARSSARGVYPWEV